ncbi:hypothetical protein HDV06_004345 [Boothiomyces sp. JEL0866]|nr:hypothetical protein HDV06_004345 [Boothiomyces sp. JEL0866]
MSSYPLLLQNFPFDGKERRKKKISDQIESYLKQEKKTFQQKQMQPKLLLLGSSDCGKSTLLKQMKIIYGKGFTDEEKTISKKNILHSITNTMTELLESHKEQDPVILDILNLRVVTQTISETVFEIENEIFHFFDVSGLRHHRKHWLTYFEDVQCVLFVVSLSSYDQYLIEDPTVNRMVDSLVLFEQTVNHPLLKKPDFILFFNKKDLYFEKIKTIPIEATFPEYKDKPHSVSKGIKFFEKKFTAQSPKKQLMFHVTCCTDTKSMEIIIASLL